MIIINTYNEGFSFSTETNLYQFSFGDVSTNITSNLVQFIFDPKIGLSNFFSPFTEITINDTQVTESNVSTLLKLISINYSTAGSNSHQVSGGRLLVENLGRPTTMRQLTLVANTVNDIQLTANIRRISIYATVDSFYLLGTTVQTPTLTSGHFIASGERLDISLNDSTTPHIAFISNSAGFIYISELTTPTP